MQFYMPQNLIFVLTIPVLILVFSISSKIRKSRLEKIGMIQTVEAKLMPNLNRQSFAKKAFYILFVFALATLALARPQWGEEKKKVQRKGVDIIFMLDTSLSMLAEDVKPSRFEKSKIEIKSFLRQLKGDRVGMIAFAGTGFLQSPLTLDYAAFLLFLDGIKVGYIPDPGTSLSRALDLTARSFPGKEMKYKAVVLFTDGEDHEGGIEPAIEAAKKAGVRVYSIGVGTAEGEPIPLRDQEGRKSGFKKNRAGEVVITKLNRPMLEKIATETGGLYLPSTAGEQEVNVILKHMESLGKKEFKEQMIAEKEDHFQLFLILAFLFLILEMFVPKTRSSNKAAQIVPVLLIFFLFTGFLESSKALNDKGNQLYKEKKYKSAADAYAQAKAKSPDDPTIRYNLATSLYQLERYQEAAKEYEKVLNAKDPKLREQALYNYGNTLYRLGNFEKAIDAYKKALEIDPKDQDAKYNLEFLQKQKSAFEKQNQERKKDQQNQQQNQQNQQQNQQNQQQNQQDQQQNQQNQQDQQEQQQNQQDQQRDQQDQGSQSDQQNQQDQKDEGQDKTDGDQQKDDQGQGEKEEKDQSQELQPEEENQNAENQAPDQEQPQQTKGPKPLQGQMELANALRILDALQENEKDLQELRRPQPPKETPPPDKDW